MGRRTSWLTVCSQAWKQYPASASKQIEVSTSGYRFPFEDHMPIAGETGLQSSIPALGSSPSLRFIGSFPFCSFHFQESTATSTSLPKGLNSLGDWIRKTRLDQRLTQVQVGELLGVTECCVTNWELVHSEPEVRYIPKIIEFIGYCPYAPTQLLVERLKIVRWALGISQRQLAKILKTNLSNVIGWGLGRHHPTRKSLELIKSFLSRVAN